MPSVFTDSANDYDLTIATSADWTIHSADLPNGDNSASLSTALNQNAVYAGEEFCLPNGSGSEARTWEVWVKVTANTNNRFIMNIRTDGTGVGATDRHVDWYLNASEVIWVEWINTSGTAFLQWNTSALSAGWHHVVCVWQCGSTKSVTVYVDAVSTGADTSTSGTPTTASSAVYKLFVGTQRHVATDEMTDHMAKLAVYDYALTPTQISDHYLAMTAT